MSPTAARPAAARPFRMCVALTIAGWITILGLALPAGMSTEPVQAPSMEIQETPVKAYRG